MLEGVPVTVDFRRDVHAREWTESAMSLRPWRSDFFDAFAKEIGQPPTDTSCRVPELGSGPGFLAERLLKSSDALSYVAVDFYSSSPDLFCIAQADSLTRAPCNDSESGALTPVVQHLGAPSLSLN